MADTNELERPTLPAVMERVSDIEGWMTPGQAATLYDAAVRCPRDGRIVEIGSFRGRSTIVLASRFGIPVSTTHILVGAVLGAAFVAIRLLERRFRYQESPFGVGVTLVVGSGCALCEPAERALVASGVTPVVIDVNDLPPTVSIRSLPVAIVTDAENMVVMRRSGHSVIADATEIAESAGAGATARP